MTDSRRVYLVVDQVPYEGDAILAASLEKAWALNACRSLRLRQPNSEFAVLTVPLDQIADTDWNTAELKDETFLVGFRWDGTPIR